MAEQFPRKLVVQAIPTRVGVEQIKALFRKFNPVNVDGPFENDAKNKSIYRLIITFPSSDMAIRALNELDYYSIMDQQIQVIPCYDNIEALLADATMSVIVHNISKSITLKKLHKVMGQFGEVLFCRYIKCDSKGEPSAFVQFRFPADADKAISGANWSNNEGGIIYASHSNGAQPDRTIFVKNIPSGVPESEAKSLFSNIDGFDEMSTRADGTAIIRFSSQEQANSAISIINSPSFSHGRKIIAMPYLSNKSRGTINNNFDISRSVFISNIPAGTCEDSLVNSLQAHVDVSKISFRLPTAIVEVGDDMQRQKIIAISGQKRIDGFPNIVICNYIPKNERISHKNRIRQSD